MFLDFFKVIVFALHAFVFLRKWLLFVLMQFSISFYSLIQSSSNIWELRTEPFSASKLILYPPLIGPPCSFISLLIVTFATKSPGIVENFLPLKLTPRP